MPLFALHPDEQGPWEDIAQIKSYHILNYDTSRTDDGAFVVSKGFGQSDIVRVHNWFEADSEAEFAAANNLVRKGLLGIAKDIGYDNTISGLAAINVQDALDEIDSDVDDLQSQMGVAGTNLGLFPGDTIPDSTTVRGALEALENALENCCGIVQPVATASFTIADNDTYPIDTTGGAITVSGNVAPIDGDRFLIVDVGGEFGTNPVTMENICVENRTHPGAVIELTEDFGVYEFIYFAATGCYVMLKESPIHQIHEMEWDSTTFSDPTYTGLFTIRKQFWDGKLLYFVRVQSYATGGTDGIIHELDGGFAMTPILDPPVGPPLRIFTKQSATPLVDGVITVA